MQNLQKIGKNPAFEHLFSLEGVFWKGCFVKYKYLI